MDIQMFEPSAFDDGTVGTVGVFGSGGQRGDVLVALAVAQGVGGIRQPGDWGRPVYIPVAGEMPFTLAVYQKTLTGPMASLYQWSSRDALAAMSVTMWRVRGVDVAHPHDCPPSSAELFTEGFMSTMTAPSITTKADGAEVVYFMACASNDELTDFTAPTGMTGLTGWGFNGTGGGPPGVGIIWVIVSKSQATAGATGDQTGTISDVFIHRAATALLALRPADTYPPSV